MLVPYSNRLYDGRLFTRQRGTLTLAPNREGVRHPVHGVGWSKRWELRASARSRVTLAYQHAADAHWPHAHACSLSVTLGPRSARFALALQNLSSEPMVAGLGLHPFLMLEADTMLHFSAKAVWDQDAAGWPRRLVPVAGHARFDFETPRRAQEVELNHCYAQWAGVAALHRPQQGLTVRVTADSALAHLVVYRPAAQPWICIEPVSHATGAFSLGALHGRAQGLRWLAPRRTLRASMEIRVIDPQP
jgi:aldose 1-epimerase